MRRMDSAQADMQIHSNEYVSPGLGRRPGTLATVGLALFSCCCVTVLLLTRTWAEPRDLMVVHCRENSSASQNTPAATSCPRNFFRSEETGQCVSCDLRGATDMAEAACRKIPAARKRLLVNPSLRRREGQVALLRLARRRDARLLRHRVLHQERPHARQNFAEHFSASNPVYCIAKRFQRAH